MIMMVMQMLTLWIAKKWDSFRILDTHTRREFLDYEHFSAVQRIPHTRRAKEEGSDSLYVYEYY